MARIEDQLRQHALQLGFLRCRFARAAAATHVEFLDEWLDDGNAAEMAWIGRRRDERADPRSLLPENALNYQPGLPLSAGTPSAD